MKTLIFFSLLLVCSTAWTKCNTNTVSVINHSGFGISFGNGVDSSSYNNKNTTNIPLSINNEPACFKKITQYSMKGEIKNGEAADNKITITPMKVEFENVPSAHFRQYFFIEKNANSILRKVHQLNFICTGEIPLSIEGGSDFVLNILKKTENASVNVTHIFATGTAAENINHKKNYPNSAVRESYNFFKILYQNKTSKDAPDTRDCCSNIKIPSILSDTSIHSLTALERKLASNYTTMGTEVPNGCSNDFIKTMEPYLLENFEKNESLEGIKIKKKWFSEDLVLEI